MAVHIDRKCWTAYSLSVKDLIVPIYNPASRARRLRFHTVLPRAGHAPGSRPCSRPHLVRPLQTWQGYRRPACIYAARAHPFATRP